MKITTAFRAGGILTLCYASYAHPVLAEDLTASTAKSSIARLFGAAPDQQKFVTAGQQGQMVGLIVDRNQFSKQTGINFLRTYLPEKIPLELTKTSGYFRLRSLEHGGYAANTAPADSEQGKTTARNYYVSGGFLDSLDGEAIVQISIGGLHYRSNDQSHEVNADDTTLYLRKGDGPTGLGVFQLGWTGKRNVETIYQQGRQVYSLDAGGYNYSLFIGGTDMNQMKNDIWSGSAVQDALYSKENTPLRTAIQGAKRVDFDYGIDEFVYRNKLLSYEFGGLDFKYSGPTCSGCEGHFTIGADAVRAIGDGNLLALKAIFPDYSWVSGTVSGLDIYDLVASENALINPFNGKLLAIPKFDRVKSFTIPSFKMAAYNQVVDLTGEGNLKVHYDGHYVVDGDIHLKLKKGAHIIDSLKPWNTRSQNAVDTIALLHKILIMGTKLGNDQVEMDIVIRNNSVKINGVSL